MMASHEDFNLGDGWIDRRSEPQSVDVDSTDPTFRSVTETPEGG